MLSPFEHRLLQPPEREQARISQLTLLAPPKEEAAKVHQPPNPMP